MQQRPENRGRSQRAQPAFPDVIVPTATLAMPQENVVQAAPAQPPVMAKKKRSIVWAFVQICLLGFLLELLYLALYPLFTTLPGRTDPLQQVLLGAVPWQERLFWTNFFPALGTWLARIPWLDPLHSELGRANLLLIALLGVFLLTLLLMRVGSWMQRGRLSVRSRELLFWTVFVFAALFGVTLLLAPMTNTPMTRDLLLYGLYGRMVAVYHVNPYVAQPGAYAQDLFQVLVGARQPATYGPVWLDISMLTSLFAQNSLARTVLSFRVLGLVAHLINILLFWGIMGRLKPELRCSTTFLYAWNPLVFVLGIAQMHQEMLLLMCLLLAIYFFVYKSPFLGWVFVLLAALLNLFYLLLLPLFFLLLLRNTRSLRAGTRLIWWLGMILVTVLVVLLAYIPYWQGWSLTGIGQNIVGIFRQRDAVNSLDAALLHLPVKLPDPLLWVLAPSHWSLGALLVLGLFLLFGLWLTDTLDLTLFFASWLLLLGILLLPIYWPWFVLVAFTLALLSGNRKTGALALLLVPGALLSYYCWQWKTVWAGQALLCLGLPLVLWGWSLFFTSTWEVMHTQQEPEEPGPKRLSRPPWLSRPSRPGRRA